jgi:hypothetical protein
MISGGSVWRRWVDIRAVSLGDCLFVYGRAGEAFGLEIDGGDQGISSRMLRPYDVVGLTLRCCWLDVAMLSA